MIILISRTNLINKIYAVLAILFLGVFFISNLSYAQPEREKEANMNNPFGVLEFLHWNHDWNNYKYASNKEIEKALKLMKEAGVGWVRVDFLWQDIESKPGEFNFDKYDNIVGLADKYGINILGILDYTADWASSCGKWNCPPEYGELFIKFAVKVANRYAGRVNYWEIWNEPDSGTYWVPQDGLKSYCVFLKDVYIALKKANPSCRVLNGGLANGLASVNRLYDNGAKDYFDILNVHYFENPVNKNAIKGVMAYPKLCRKVMDRHGDQNKKIWITEIGCPGVKRGQKTEDWWIGRNPTESRQALWATEVYSELLKVPSVEKVFWAFFRDTKNHWGNGVDYFGLIRWDFSKKPAFKAYKKCYENWKKRNGAGGGS